MLKLHTKSCLSSRFLQKLIEETAEGFEISSSHANIPSTGQKARVFPMDIKDACVCLPLHISCPGFKERIKNLAKPLPHKICWPQDLLHLAGDVPSQLQVQKSVLCFLLMAEIGIHHDDSLSLQDGLAEPSSCPTPPPMLHATCLQSLKKVAQKLSVVFSE